MNDPVRITTRCPSCGHSTLFVGDGGHLTCSWLECKHPSVAVAIEHLQAKGTLYDVLEGLLIAAGYAKIVHKAQVIDRPHANDAGQRYAMATFARESPDDELSSRRRGSAGNFDELNAEILGPDSFGGSDFPDVAIGTSARRISAAEMQLDPTRCGYTLNGRQCAGLPYHADSVNATPHSFSIPAEQIGETIAAPVLRNHARPDTD